MARKRLLVTLALVVGVPALLFVAVGGPGALRAGQLIRDALRPAAELAEHVAEETRRIAGVEVHLHRPREAVGALPAVVVCHGAVPRGARDKRLIALARALALRGALVATPHFESLRTFRADPEDPVRLAEIAVRLAEDGDRVAGGRVALVGISIGGSYAIVAASRPEARDRISCVFSLGGYEDLERVIHAWMVSPDRDAPELEDPAVEGRRRTLLANADHLVPAQDLRAVRRILRALLAGEPVPPAAAEGLSAGGRRLVSCARSTEPIDPATAHAVLAPASGRLKSLSPGHEGTAPAAPVFLLHGVDDPVVPVGEAKLLRRRLEALGTEVDYLTTALFGHVGAERKPSLVSGWSLARFLARFLDEAGL
jgi:dienelactone hydrolase